VAPNQYEKYEKDTDIWYLAATEHDNNVSVKFNTFINHIEN